MQGLVTLVAMLLGLITLIAPLVGFVWVGILGEWSIFFASLAAYFGGALAISLLMSPGLLLSSITVDSMEKGNSGTASFVGMLSILWTLLAVTVWCFGVQYYLFGEARYSHYWPFGLLAFGICLAPIARLVRADGNNPHSQITMFAMMLATTISTLYSITQHQFSVQIFYVIYSIAALVCIASSAALIATINAQRS